MFVRPDPVHARRHEECVGVPSRRGPHRLIFTPGSTETATSDSDGPFSAAGMARAPKRKRAAKKRDTARMRIFCLFMRFFLVT